MSRLRADIGMSLVVDAESYVEIGALMDIVRGSVVDALTGKTAAFDFTHFQTHPCKELQMQRLARQDGPTPEAAYNGLPTESRPLV